MNVLGNEIENVLMNVPLVSCMKVLGNGLDNECSWAENKSILITTAATSA